MAKAISIADVQLTLSHYEAVALAVVLNRVAGDPKKSRRGLIKAILKALQTDGGIPPQDGTMDDVETGSVIWFKDTL